MTAACSASGLSAAAVSCALPCSNSVAGRRDGSWPAGRSAVPAQATSSTHNDQQASLAPFISSSSLLLRLRIRCGPGLDRLKIDLALVEVHPHDAHAQPVAKAVRALAALT